MKKVNFRRLPRAQTVEIALQDVPVPLRQDRAQFVLQAVSRLIWEAQSVSNAIKDNISLKRQVNRVEIVPTENINLTLGNRHA